MANKIMKTFTVGDNTYEIVDEKSRNEIQTLKQQVNEPDTTLTIEGALAEAKSTGDAINKVASDLSNASSEMSNAITTAQNTADAAVTAAENAQNTADEALSKAGVTSVNGQTGDIVGVAVVNQNDIGNADERFSINHPDSDVQMIFYKDGRIKVWNGSEFVSMVYSDVSLPPSDKVTTNGSEGQICAVNSDGTISPNARTIASLGTGATYSLDEVKKILTITTIE